MPIESVTPGQGAGRSVAPTVMTRYRWVICALLFFSTTFNYLDRQVISYLKEYFCAPLESSASFSTFSANDLNLPVFADKLGHSTDAVSVYIKSNLSAGTVVALENYPGTNSVSLQTNLVLDLNALI